MEGAGDDRRKMLVTMTAAGGAHRAGKHAYLERYFDEYVDVLGEKNISDLTALLKVTADSEEVLMQKFGRGNV